MNYEETIQYLYDFAPMFQQVGTAGYKEGMENSFLLDEHFGRPHRKYATVHVAGTNGKGSVSHLLASILMEAGCRVGLYTSPHLLDFRERIRINGQPIEKEYVINFVEKERAFFEPLHPSFFELTTSLAFKYFADKEVDIAVIEVGLGGRLDCTNVITPLLSIITNISFDHVNLLGNTLTAIASEKAGIIKPGIPVVVGEAEGEVKEYFSGLQEKIEFPGCLIFADEQDIIKSSRLLPSGFWEFETKKYPHLVCELGGFAQEKNAATTLCALDALPVPPVPKEAVYNGFRRVIENTGLMGRWQIVGQNPKIVLDTGHNIGGIAYTARQLAQEKYRRLHIVFGMVKDKDISAVLALLPRNAQYYFTQAAIPRALNSKDLQTQAAAFGLKGEIFASVATAFSAAKQSAAADDFIFVGGSTFVVTEVLEKLQSL
ncbi:MAG: bifunctional folylpolyglutamate synthase/dihydrofolate synthase [Dysgonamonadaceae bacterium]|jgi:dihydrofolate synthase/folylpolyglutamate synthase|nr:bifunctional folylpolyglutamate synthase/dihydrofolate synthase [Dysgonamonadaceae bacterium]